MEGKLIVISGSDGSGKATQTQLLIARLRANNRDVEATDFPQYGSWSAVFVEKYLNGLFGTAEEVGPYKASIFFALDRYSKHFEMKKWLEKGKIIISNRYVSANQGHQGGKIQDPAKRKEYLDWLDHLEFKLFNIPRPDLNLFLHVPPEIGRKLVGQKGARDYLGGKKRDIHEADINHQKNTESSYLYLVNNFPGWRKIDCMKNNKLRSKEDIHEEIWKIVREII